LSKIRVAVLMGGKSTEREVSLSTGGMILKSLDARKYNAFPVDTAAFGRDAMTLPAADVAFIALHGRFGEDGTVQGLLELLGIPYVGSGVLASALAMDKIMARRVLRLTGIPLPADIELRKGVGAEDVAERIGNELGYPAVVKPNCQGSTIGLSIARVPSEVAPALDAAFAYDRDVLIEQFIEGTEITGAVIGNDELQVLPLVEIVPEGGF
jgi:D-alanine-D-alanine ligase